MNRRWKKIHLLWWLLAAAIIATAAYQLLVAPGLMTARKGAPSPGDQQHPVLVTAVPAQKADFAVYLKELGTITPVNTTVIKSQVGGQIRQIHFAEGQVVKAGDVLAEIDPRPFEVQLMQAEGQLARDESLLKNAENDLARYRLLLAQDSIAEQQATTQESLVQQLQGAVKTDRGLIESARLQLTYARVTAPITGRIGLRQVDVGNMIQPGDASGIAVITQLQPITVIFSVPQENLPAILKRLRSGADLPVQAYSQDEQTLLASGRLLAVDNQIDTATGTVKMKAEFANRANELFPNQFVNVRMKVDTLAGATVVPTAAIQRGPAGTFVYVIGKDHKTTIRPIRLGPAEADRAAVATGLVPGESVVTVGGDKLREGSSVEIAGPTGGAAAPVAGKQPPPGGRANR